MVFSKHFSKRAVSVVLVLALMLGMTLFSVQFSAADTDVAQTSADTYYLWAENSNGPNFSSMTSPTGKFTYDSSKGYYYYDVQSFAGGDYCFVISTNSTNGSSAVGNQAVTKVAAGGSYYLTMGNYSGYSCFHIWNDRKEPVRIYFTSASAGVNADPLSSVGGGGTTQQPTNPPATTAPQPTTPTPTTPQGGGSTATTGNLVYCKNSAGWSAVSVYMWNDAAGTNNGGWPGKNATNIGNDIWQYEVPGDYTKIIFSNSGSSQTGDMSYPGNGYIYDNKSNSWSIYDTSPIQVRAFTTDLPSPQYKEMDIVLSALAVGNGDMSYRFSVKNKSNNSTVVVSDYSKNSSAVWTPTAVGNYTITFEFKDAAGNTNSRTLDYEVKDDSTLANPVIKSITPAEGQILKGTAQSFSVKAGGAKTGTNLIFYKYTVKDETGAIVNVPYFTKNSTYSFTPTKLGTYTVTVVAQSSDNSEDVRTYTYDAVNNISAPTELSATLSYSGSTTVGSKVTLTAGARGGTTPYTYRFTVDGSVVQNFSSVYTYTLSLGAEKTYNVKVDVKDAKGVTVARSVSIMATQPAGSGVIKGDSDDDGQVTIVDATVIQRYLAKLITDSELNKANSDVDGDGDIAIIDATHIQRYLAKLENW